MVSLLIIVGRCRLTLVLLTLQMVCSADCSAVAELCDLPMPGARYGLLQTVTMCATSVVLQRWMLWMPWSSLDYVLINVNAQSLYLAGVSAIASWSSELQVCYACE